mgnify:CR=1 FL=1
MATTAVKYRVHEVAKDFGIATKDVTEILTKYAETPKNHMQVLEDGERFKDVPWREPIAK